MLPVGNFYFCRKFPTKDLVPSLWHFREEVDPLIRCSLVAVLSHWGQAFLGAVRHSLLFVFSFFSFLPWGEWLYFIKHCLPGCACLSTDTRTRTKVGNLQNCGPKKTFSLENENVYKKIFYNLDKNYFKQITSNYALNISL